MPTLIAGIIAVVLIYAALNIIKGADPKFLARIIRSGGGVLALAFAAFIGARGEIAVAVPIAIFGAGLLGWSPFGAKLGAAFGNWGGNSRKSNGQQSQVRSKFVEMTLDHDTGALEGRLTAGPEAGRVLDEFTLDELLALARGFDGESWALLESYLDRRFPAWRQDAHDATAGGFREDRGAAPSGKMTPEEAYQILGLQSGATRDEISRAHRSLMKKLHPDQGGSTYLAARVNEAKDTLLRTHRS
ncbi:molecular chaperone DnaJ [Afipia sp. Root123D2]|uniref:DnaJ domain-containing protein n=1 Tax=Afipia sp. Root123D2 TaxID=1736436 RepID=UPI0006FC97BD|nr:DnaJ domain-containing protein [Afipia sp. Root123D2]KQW22708.1 molecular chaperone DnaJ [Afipia sp. Root123D2]